VQKKFENNLSLEEEIVLSVKKVVEDLRSPEDHEVVHRRRRQVAEDREIRELSAPEGLPRENKDLRGVMESRVDPSHWCWEGHMAEIHGLWRKNPSEERQGGEHPKSWERRNPGRPLR
jgi:hypothetical protein